MEVTWAIIEEALGALKTRNDMFELESLLSNVRLKALAREPLELEDLVKILDTVSYSRRGPESNSSSSSSSSGAMNYRHD